MERRIVNPWTWQDEYGFVQANEVSGPARFLFCAGQASLDENGRPVHLGDMAGQLRQTLDNVETVLRAGGYELADVVRLNVFTTDFRLLFEHFAVYKSRLAEAGCKEAGTIVGAAALGLPGLLVEIEATAAK